MEPGPRAGSPGLSDDFEFGDECDMEWVTSSEVFDAHFDHQTLLGSFARGAAARESFDPLISELVTFGDMEELLRGSPLATVMRCRGEIFKNSAGSSETYALSNKVSRLDAFVSHNWSVSREQKFLALALVFNFGLVSKLFAGFLLCLAVGAWNSVFPFIEDRGQSNQVSYVCRCCAIPVFFILMFYIRDIQRVCCGYEGPVLFVDKLCIHQEDRALQRAGIEKLAAFLANADSMVILYTDEYLKKLWTVYEVAAFLALHPISRMRVVPITKAKVFLTASMAIWASDIFVMVVWTRIHLPSALIVVQAIAGPLYMGALRKWAREKDAIRSRLSEFSVHHCTCFDEDDRPLVCRNIAALMRATNVVPRSAPDEMALRTFNHLVREELPGAFTSSFGQVTYDYWHCVWLGVLAYVPRLLDSLDGKFVTSAEGQEYTLGKTLAQGVDYSTRVFVLIPLMVLAMEFFASSHLSLRSYWAWAYLQLCMLFGVLTPASGAVLILNVMEGWAKQGALQLLGFAAFGLTAARLTWMLFHKGGWGTCARRERVRTLRNPVDSVSVSMPVSPIKSQPFFAGRTPSSRKAEARGSSLGLVRPQPAMRGGEPAAGEAAAVQLDMGESVTDFLRRMGRGKPPAAAAARGSDELRPRSSTELSATILASASTDLGTMSAA